VLDCAYSYPGMVMRRAHTQSEVDGKVVLRNGNTLSCANKAPARPAPHVKQDQPRVVQKKERPQLVGENSRPHGTYVKGAFSAQG
jgi:hypothetical protein